MSDWMLKIELLKKQFSAYVGRSAVKVRSTFLQITLLVEIACQCQSAFGQSVPDISSNLEAYNVVWNSPGPTSAQSMPIGNGDIGLNVWVETNGDLLFYIGKTDAWNEDVLSDQGLMKLGAVRVSLKPNPLTAHATFLQMLKLETGEIQIQEGAANLRIWVDANNPVVRVEVANPQPITATISLNNWRPTSAADVTLPDETNRIIWYHQNPATANTHVANLTFGAEISGQNLTNVNTTSLISSVPSVSQLFTIYPLTAQTSTVPEWLELLDEEKDRITGLDLEQTREAHQRWWHNFWERSWIFMSGDQDATNVTEGYVLQRFITACSGRGAFPIKFNGSIFIVDDPARRRSADSRDWGGQYWFQNTRAMYWPRLMAGDFDIMRPLFNMYAKQLNGNATQVAGYYHHQGAYFAETAPFWGGLKYEGPEVEEDWTGHYFTPVLELSMMMLDYYEYTGDKKFAQETLLPVATAGLTFFDQHFVRDGEDKLILDPDNAIEMYWKVHNPAPDIAGLRAILPRVLNLSDDLLNDPDRKELTKLYQEIPELPTGLRGGKNVLFPYTGPQTARPRNGENPELYAIYPFRLYGLGMPDLRLAIDSFNTRKMTQMGCWVQDPIQAAMLGLTDVAKRYTVFNLTRKDPGLKFPAFWAHGSDYQPDEDNGGNGENALQLMLMQNVGRKILLLPAWPREWNATFKLHAPFQTTVQGAVQNGRLIDLVVSPSDRLADVIDMSTNISLKNALPMAAGEDQPTRVACIGDSIVFGTGLEDREQNNWPTVLGQWLGSHWQVRNFGIDDATVIKKGDKPYRNQPAFMDVLNFKPDIIIISLGSNDSKHPNDSFKDAIDNWQYKSEFVSDYKEMIAALRAANPNAKLYLCIPSPAYPGRWGINDETIREEIAPLIRQIAVDNVATLVDLYTPLSGKPELFPDTVYPNVTGSRIIAATVYEKLTGKPPSVENSSRVENLLSPHDEIYPLKRTVKGNTCVLAVSGDFGGIDGNGEQVANLIDGKIETKYFNKVQDAQGGAPGVDTGFLITPVSGAKPFDAIQFCSANDFPERDPLFVTVEGTNDPLGLQAPGGSFTLLYEGPSGLENDLGRGHWGRVVIFDNRATYKSYRILVTATRSDADAAQYAEIRLGSAVFPVEQHSEF